MADATTETKRYEVRIDLQGLIRLLAKNLYAEADVFVREMVQNAHDSIRRRAEIEGDSAPLGFIRIRTDWEAGTITITDNGSGLTEQEIHDYLSTIGRSGTGEFRNELMKKGRHADVSLIGQFGIGLLSAFVVAHTVEVETLSVQPGSPPWRWASEGQSDYELGPGSRVDEGTTVTLHISKDYRDMLNADEIRKAVKKYADFIPYPIYLNDEGATANAVHAPWHRTFLSDSERLQEYYLFVNQRFPDFSLEVIPIDLQAPYRVQGVLYISDRHIPDMNTTGMVDIYQTRMFITANNRDMLPPWAKFVRGVIDSPDLTPTAARDAIQLDTAAREIRDALGAAVVAHLKQLAVRDSVRFERIMEWHSYHVKGMAVAHDDFFDAIADLVPFETNRGPMNLSRYSDLSPTRDGHSGRDVFYFSESGTATQFYMLCNAKGLLVISAGHMFEENFLRKYAKRRPDVRLHLISVAGSEFLFEPLAPEEVATFRNLELDFQRTMPDHRSQARVVRFKPASLPAVTVLTADAKLHKELEEARQNLVMPASVRDLAGRILGERTSIPVILYLNADNPTIQQMAQMAAAPLHADAYNAANLAIYNNAMLLARHVITPDDAQAIFASSNNIISLMIQQTESLTETRARLSTVELSLREREREAHALDPSGGRTDHVTCMVALPFRDHDTFAYESVLLPALRAVLEVEPYYWQVVRADEKYLEDTVEGNVTEWMRRAHAYIADISDLNPNVMMELGYMRWAEPSRSRPLIVLEREGCPQHLSDIAGLIRIRYPAASGNNAVAEVSTALKNEFRKVRQVEELNASKNAHYLSPLLLKDSFRMDASAAMALSRACPTMESLVSAESEEILQLVPTLTRGVLRGLQEDLRDLLVTLTTRR